MRAAAVAFASIVFLISGSASAVVCQFASGVTSTWSAVGTISPASSCGTPTTADSFVIPAVASTRVNVTGNLVGIVGSLTVGSGAELDIQPLVSVEFRGGIVYQSGSCPADSCDFGVDLKSTTVPYNVTHPNGSTIVLDFTEVKTANMPGLPWTICDSGCGPNDVQVGTLIAVDWQKFGAQDAGIVRPVDAMGMILEVTAVSAAADSVTLSLPRVETNATTNSYTVAENVVSNRITNLVNQAAWTVSSTTLAENNEGKLRYETLLAAGAPFDTAGEFSGLLACATGTDRCARIVYTEPNYSTTQDMFTTLRNPALLWKAGDVLDVYFARLFPGDRISPFNPAVITKTADGTADAMIVNPGSNLFTIDNLWLKNAWSNHVPSQRTAALAIQNGQTTARKTLRHILFSSCDGPDVTPGAFSTAVACLGIENPDATGGPTVPDGDIIQNLIASDLYFTFPQVVIATSPTLDAFAAFAVVLNEEASQSISVENSWNGVAGAKVADWQNVTFRRIRVDGFNAGFAVASAGRFNNCDGGLMYQDILTANSRSSKPRDAVHLGEDQVELFPNSATCGLDRVTVMRSNVGTGIGPFRWGRPDGGAGFGGTVYATNLVELGGPAQQGNTTSAANRSAVDYTFPSPTPNISPEGHTHAYPGPDGNGYFISNYLIDGQPFSISSSYGSILGWWTQRATSWAVRYCGQRWIGTFRIGGSAAAGQGLNSFLACAGPLTDIVYADNYFVNQGGPINNGTLQNCLIDGTGSGSKYQCNGVAAVNNGGLITANANLAPMPSLIFDSNIFGWGAHDTAFKTLAWFDSTTKVVPSFKITNTTLYGDYSNIVRIFDDSAPGVGLNSVASVQVGPNVWAMTGSTERCDSTGDTPTDALTCLFPGPIGDLSPDNSPHGGTSINLAGDILTGRGMRVVGTANVDGNDPTLAQPRHAGPIVWDVFSWVTPELSDLTHFDSGRPPLWEYVPTEVAKRAKGGSGARGSRFGVSSPFGVN